VLGYGRLMEPNRIGILKGQKGIRAKAIHQRAVQHRGRPMKSAGYDIPVDVRRAVVDTCRSSSTRALHGLRPFHFTNNFSL
jgi:hypothetical protein